jgi:hypothetical protein
MKHRDSEVSTEESSEVYHTEEKHSTFGGRDSTEMDHIYGNTAREAQRDEHREVNTEKGEERKLRVVS